MLHDGLMVVGLSLLMLGKSQYFNEAQKQRILNEHNAYRGSDRLSPYTSSYMEEMTWDDGLAVEADRWARGCVFQHYTDGYGQNLYADWGRGRDGQDSGLVDSMMKGWGEDEKRVLLQQVGQVNAGERIGQGLFDHYTQIVWDSTKKVGCAFAVNCPNMDRYVVCNYYPPGNFQGMGWYEVGTPCSKCSGSCSSDGLCLAGGSGPVTNPPVTTTETPNQGPSSYDLYQGKVFSTDYIGWAYSSSASECGDLCSQRGGCGGFSSFEYGDQWVCLFMPAGVTYADLYDSAPYTSGLPSSGENPTPTNPPPPSSFQIFDDKAFSTNYESWSYGGSAQDCESQCSQNGMCGGFSGYPYGQQFVCLFMPLSVSYRDLYDAPGYTSGLKG